MSGETKNGMQCAEFDALLIEALDGTLTGYAARCSRKPMGDVAG